MNKKVARKINEKTRVIQRDTSLRFTSVDRQTRKGSVCVCVEPRKVERIKER